MVGAVLPYVDAGFVDILEKIDPNHMDIRKPTLLCPNADCFVSDVSPTSADADKNLTEDDIFSFVDFSNRSHNQLSFSPSLPSSHHRGTPSSSAFSPSEASFFGILAALSEKDPHHIFNHKAALVASSSSSTSVASLSTSSISASRKIPSIPKPPPPLNERCSGKYHQSAPMNVPVLADLRKRGGGFVGDEYDEIV